MKFLPMAAVALLAACAGGPPPPEWQMNAHGAMERFVAAYMAGNTRVETAEFDKARSEIARTGRSDLLARAELLRCAARVASLVVEPCEGFEKLRQDAPPAERAYADYLSAKLQPQDLALLPAPQRAAAAASADVAALNRIADPLSRLVAAGVMFQAARASPAVMALAVDTASAQGWRRPLLAWLGLQARRAEQAGDPLEAERLRRRMALVQGASG
ncbi:MAG: hypothetical protein ACRECD_12070 [Burkholderiaceae bacterium]